MTLTTNPDINRYLLNFFLPRTLINYGMVDKQANILTKLSPIYLELCRLKLNKKLYRFDSYEVIKHYYKYGMVNLIIQHRFDHHRAAIMIATYGYLELLQFIFQSVHTPIATYSLTDHETVFNVLILASKNGHLHIIKWFAYVGITDHELCPTTINGKTIAYYYINDLKFNIINYASRHGRLDILCGIRFLLPDLWDFCDIDIIMKNAFKHNHWHILDWLLTIINDQDIKSRSGHIYIDVPYDTNPEKIAPYLEWFWQNYDKFYTPLRLHLKHICLLGRWDVVEQMYARFDDIIRIDDIMWNIIPSGNLASIQWFYHKEPTTSCFTIWVSQTIDQIVYYGHLHILEWLASTLGHEYVLPFHTRGAIKQGHIAILEWFEKNKISIDCPYHIVERIACDGYIHVLHWLHIRQLLPERINTTIIEAAIIGGQLQVLRWLGETNIVEVLADPDTKYRFIRLAIKHNHVDILTLFQSYGSLPDFMYQVPWLFMDNAFEPETDCYAAIRWLKEQYDNIDFYYIICWAIRKKFWHIVEWIISRISRGAISLPTEYEQKLAQWQQYRDKKLNLQ